MTPAPSPFIWYDLMTPDLKAAERFYAAVVGWTIADSGMPGMSYSILKAGEVMVGGMMGMMPGGPTSMWTGYIYSADVDADAERAVKLGGSICKEPADIPGVGRFAVLADPGGAMFNIFKPNSSESPAEVAPNTPGHIAWNSLSTGDAAREWAFYESMFGWTKAEAHQMGPDLVYQTFATGKAPVGGMMNATAQHPDHKWTFLFAVAGIDAATKRVSDNGGKVLMGPMQVPGGNWIIDATDPAGAGFGLVSASK